MLKEKVVEILTAKKEEKLSAVAAEFDALIAQVSELEEPSGSEEVEALKAQLLAVEGQLAAVQAAFAADEVEDEAALASEKEQVAKLQAKLDAIKAALEG